MEIGLVVLAVALAGAVAVAVGYGHELKRTAAFLDERDPASNARLRIGSPLPGASSLVGAVNRQLDESQAMLQQQKRDEQQFQGSIASLSHDIRTPLAGARGYLQLADDTAPEGEVAEYLQLAERRLGAMQGMVDQLFDYTRSLNPETFAQADKVDVLAVLASVLVGSYPSFARKGWEPQVSTQDDVLWATVNEEALRRIFDNVVANMLSHGSGDVVVSQAGRQVEFRNRAEGLLGLEATKLFDRFYRGEPSRTTSGAGLGLAVVKNLCDGQAIKVSVEVKDGCFAITFGF